ncbi:MAG: hypothetical protein JSS44_11105 [Proteobacteria bacterium]|nr:hypothetical protein [Pseudomonadota bacterium]
MQSPSLGFTFWLTYALTPSSPTHFHTVPACAEGATAIVSAPAKASAGSSLTVARAAKTVGMAGAEGKRPIERSGSMGEQWRATGSFAEGINMRPKKPPPTAADRVKCNINGASPVAPRPAAGTCAGAGASIQIHRIDIQRPAHLARGFEFVKVWHQAWPL